ncbi:hypothetical protein H1P_300006 [Hyella patelloides LEGE 07179]|uniref:Uncharacterized protein n=1 Tax=Hyella patelloides LEGE 07179 TaxID=945734 RepID=A0A563VUB6_9CYAN|nr:hypothetical protein H1P_300006 [Hyella patelloides LEGE 07179]
MYIYLTCINIITIAIHDKNKNVQLKISARYAEKNKRIKTNASQSRF